MTKKWINLYTIHILVIKKVRVSKVLGIIYFLDLIWCIAWLKKHSVGTAVPAITAAGFGFHFEAVLLVCD